MFGISFLELLTIMLVILLFFGPDKLPEAARTFGKIMGSFKKQSDSLRREFYNAIYTPSEDIRQKLQNEMRNLIAVDDEVPDPASLNCEEQAKKDQTAPSSAPEKPDNE